LFAWQVYAPETALVCPSNVRYGLIASISSVTAAGKEIIFGDCCNTTFSAVVCYYPCHHSPRKSVYWDPVLETLWMKGKERLKVASRVNVMK
jgi:hypothetical protein